MYVLNRNYGRTVRETWRRRDLGSNALRPYLAPPWNRQYAATSLFTNAPLPTEKLMHVPGAVFGIANVVAGCDPRSSRFHAHATSTENGTALSGAPRGDVSKTLDTNPGWPSQIVTQRPGVCDCVSLTA